MAYEYTRERRRLFRSMAKHCHDKAIESNFPKTVAEYAAVIDALLWASCDDGDADLFHTLLKDRS